MIYDIIYTNYAEECLNNIYDYISIVLLNKKAASKTINGIISTIKKLNQFPNRNQLSEDEYLCKLGIRLAYYKNYRILYKIYEDNKCVTILYIMYGGMDYSSILSRVLKK